MKIGIFTALFQDRPLADALRLIADQGYEMVELPAFRGNPHLDLTLMVSAGRFGFRRKVDVEAWCVLHGPVEDPFVGCLECVEVVEL